jgi:YD repeat-containing protein
MKKLSALSVLFISIYSFPQYSPQEIKKFRISKIMKLVVTKGDEAVQKMETWYDNNGNDTAEYNGAELYRRTKYEYNPNGGVVTRTRYKKDGNEIETAVYNYKPDGSYTISNTDKDFGMTDLTCYDKSGKVTRTASPDGTERLYTYDAKGHLTRIKSKPNNGGIITDLQYTYNPKGQLTREVSKGDYKWIITYIYDAKGMIAKIKRNSVTDGVADPEVITTYEYELIK